MGELRYIVEIDGFDRILYEESAHWEKCLLAMEDISKAHVEIWESGVDTPQELEFATVRIKEKLHRLVLALEWTYGRELQIKVIKVSAPSFGDDANPTVLAESIEFRDQPSTQVKPRKVPPVMPEVPLEAERLVVMWKEVNKLGDYVEEQLRRHYLIIEELWDEFQNSFDANDHAHMKQVKLIRDFVSHAVCDNKAVIALVEPNLPSAVVTVKGEKRVTFLRTVEHRNYVAQFEVVSRKLARSLVDMKMRQFGRVAGV
jgi:hypothetical protein